MDSEKVAIIGAGDGGKLTAEVREQLTGKGVVVIGDEEVTAAVKETVKLKNFILPLVPNSYRKRLNSGTNLTPAKKKRKKRR